MLFLTEAISKETAEIARAMGSGKVDEVTGARRLLELVPDSAMPYLFLGNDRLAAGDLDQAESFFWEGLQRQPCQFVFYLSLADVRLRRDANDAMSHGLRLLAFHKLAIADEISDAFAEHFRKSLPQEKYDFSDPETYEIFATMLEIERKDQEEPPQVVERLRPYRLLNELQRGAPTVVDWGVLDQIRDDPARFVPLLHAGLREWGRNVDAVSPEAVSLIAAVLGDIASAEVLPDLLEASNYNNELILLHAHWAVWRMGQRFPAETLAAIRAAIPQAPLALRCGLAEQLGLLPDVEGIVPASFELLEGFAQFVDRVDAPYLLAALADGLAERDLPHEAQEVLAYETMLSKNGRKWLREELDSEVGFVPKLILEGIPELDIEDICIKRALLGDEEDEDDEEYDEDEEDLDLEDEEDEDDLEPPEPVIRPIKPGRNDPCWCGSGKKYKKCHLAADEQAERDRGEPEV